ncbi:TIR domain-containing protein [Saccharothrix saharensis]|uniref:TIR domain-containing protein n=1 Tax=Saccharothrix saharensis TaxID=571190 RepID=A0A543JRC9_9PSEU|nr:toll/interleukin-1 receptor domain-containing protein [Saccharothrix saharensis]TQM85401.1 TIR domain-containing protein [Saccharothrix saharensis]
MLTEVHYTAFISYQSASRPTARHLKERLYAVAGRHERGTGFRLFLDESDLRPGPLAEEIRGALDRSRFLVVLLDTDTPRSEWVNEEIRHWLASTGHVDRLVLVRVGEIDLSWDDDRRDFAVPDAVPAALRGVFEVEQKWIDHRPRWSWRDSAALVALCARLMDVQPSDYLIEETRYQRRRTRTAQGVAAVTLVLLVVALVAGVVAVRNRQEAERNASEARAQADAAEALLAVPGTPTAAIERVLRAARDSDSPTVRSAMLAVSQGSSRLEHALRHPGLTDLAFAPDSRELLAWGRQGERTAVRSWDVATSTQRVDTTVPATGLSDLTRVGPNHLVACADQGPIVVDLAATTTRLDGEWTARGPCRVTPFDGGAVLLGPSSAHVVDRRGEVTTTDGVDRVVALSGYRHVALSGSAGVFVVAAGRAQRLDVPLGSSVEATDPVAALVLRAGPTSWLFATPGPGGYRSRALTVPDTAVEVAPLFDLGKLTGDLAWITADGTLGWTRDERRGHVEDVEGHPMWQPKYDTRLEPLANGAFVAVQGNTATIVRPPTGSPPVDVKISTLPPDWRTEWTRVPVRQRIGVPESGDTDPVVARCQDRSSVLLATDAPVGTSLLVDATALAVPVRDGRYTPGCALIDLSDSLVHHDAVRAGQTVIRTPFQADAVAFSPSGGRVAVLNEGFPIEVLSTGNERRPWDVATTVSGDITGGVVTAFGEREVVLVDDGLVFTDARGVVERVPVSDAGAISAVEPDGTGALLASSPGTGVTLVDGRAATAGRCRADGLRYVPAAGYLESLAAAETPVPVDREGTDCRTGSHLSDVPDVVSYDLGATTGRIVARTDHGLAVTTWVRGDESSLRTVPGPPAGADDEVSFDPAARTALVHTPGARALDVYRYDGGTWRPAATAVAGVGRVEAASLVDDGTLLLAIGSTGGFQLFDATSGRLVVNDPGTLDATEVVATSARRIGDELVVHLKSDADRGRTIRIPVAIPALRRQLCEVYRTEHC